MFRTVGDQVPLWESVLPPELLKLPVELSRVDELLDDAAFFAPFVPFSSLTHGRPSTPMGVCLRLMFLKFRHGLGYESLCREVADSFTWRRFCRIPLDGPVPHPTTAASNAIAFRAARVRRGTAPGLRIGHQPDVGVEADRSARLGENRWPQLGVGDPIAHPTNTVRRLSGCGLGLHHRSLCTSTTRITPDMWGIPWQRSHRNVTHREHPNRRGPAGK